MSRLIVIDRGAQQLRFVECDTRGSRVVIRRAVAVPIVETPGVSETDVVQQLIARELAGFSGGDVVGLMGRSHTVLRDLKLPDVPASELPSIVQLQAIRELSFPVEQAAIDYEVVGEPDSEGQRRVILAALQRDVIDRFQSSIPGSFRLVRVGLRPYATWRAYRAVSAVPNSGAVLVVALAGQSLELTVGQGDSVLFSRATVLRSVDGKGDGSESAGALVSEVRRTLAAFGNQVPGVLVDRVAVAAGPDELAASTDALANAGLQLPVDRFDPFSAVDVGREVKQSLGLGVEYGSYVGAIGAAISAQEIWPIDFLNPKKPVEVRDRRKPIAILAAAAAAILVVGSYGMVQWQLAKGRSRIQDLADRNAKLQKVVKEQSEIIRKYQAVVQWRETGIDALGLMDRLSDEHPETKEMYVTSIRMERDRTPGGGGSKIVLDGLARQQLTVSEFNTKLNGGEHFSARPVGSTQRQKSGGEYPYSFKADITANGK